MKKLEDYCNKMLLNYVIEDDTLEVQDKLYLILDDDQILFDEDFDFAPEQTTPIEEDYEGYVFEFGGRWYLHSHGEEVVLNELKYVGRAKQKMPTKAFLGIHSGYELLNGIGLYKDWIKKAKFLGVESLAIVEKSTLAGALDFQSTCKSNGIKSIIGLTIPLEEGTIKLYARDFQGWLNLLYFNSKLNVDEEHFIEIMDLKLHRQGLFIVADPKVSTYSEELLFVDFYQLDTVIFKNEDKDAWYMRNLEKWIKGKIEPISITDAYYLEKEDAPTRELLWSIAKAYHEKTDNEYFKSKPQYAKELIQMFVNSDKSWVQLYNKAVGNEQFLVEQCNFEYDTDTRHLPKYIMTENEANQFETNEELFMHLIKKGFKERKIKDVAKYIDRLKIEIDVLRKGDVVDYFLSLHDIIEYAKRENMLTGIARGSAGGSLVAYLLGIIQIDPLEFDLLFERFLNSGRMGEYEDRPMYTIEFDDGKKIEFAEGSLVRIKRDDKETVVFVHELQHGDQYIKH